MLILNIYKKRMKNNVEIIKNINNNIMWVLKDNAYGIGILEIYQILDNFNEKTIGLSTFNEIKLIRDFEQNNNLKKSKIYMLNILEKEYLIYAIKEEIYITLTNFRQLNEYINILKSNKINPSNLIVNIKVDTGMNRLGFNLTEKEELYKLIKENNIKIQSIYTHIGNYLNEDFVDEQSKKLEKFSKYFKEKGYDFKIHIQASPTLFKYGKKYNYDMARIGMSLYGLNPLPELNIDFKLQNIISLKTKILEIKNIKSGEYLGYETNKINKDIKIAIIYFGYAHGMYKKYNKYGYVSIKNKKYKIISEICMDMIFIDITGEDINIDDDVYILNEDILPSDISKNSNTIADDILCKLPNFNIKRLIIEE